MSKVNCFLGIVDDIRRVDSLRDSLLSQAFCTFESTQAGLASMLLQNVGDRHRAERWMSTQRRAFDGKSAYELLAEGDLDRVWDRVSLDNLGGEPTDHVRGA